MSTFDKKIIKTDKAPAAVGTYSQGVEFRDMILFSGQIGLHPETGVLASGFEAQLAQTLANIDGLLESQNLTRDHILKTTIFLTDLSEFGKVNEAYLQYFASPFPARSCVEVPRLPKDALIEIEVIAARKP
ncbi:Rid family detoxifying hydrolase [Bacteriovorax sp. Seq25_V]|uniref:Rid family detoxifying hydrolase n=1 Tax=Bacteriovorax sp. Seq25_V TaxID=1201288 RepID=UPI00038A4289|nr:Rid family detoxifying hydrolase [Bacteriovorax sp. Seq25_V]EQC47604.1 putative endoribonuclease L-PSP [Bacteriovorax sp. Seq25_V]